MDLHPTLVEYAAQEMMKGKRPPVAARATKKRLDGRPNMFLGSPVDPVTIDEHALEAALWQRLVDGTLESMARIRPGFEHFALGFVTDTYGQNASVRAEVKRLVIMQLGLNPFVNDDDK